MRLVPVLFPCDLGRHEDGRYVKGGARGAPDVLLDMLEGEGIRLARPVAVPVELPGDIPTDSDFPFDAVLGKALDDLATAVESVNSNADFPLVLGGDHLSMCGHLLGHSRRHDAGIGLAVLADAYLDLVPPGEGHPVLGQRSALQAALGRVEGDGIVAQMAKKSALQADHCSVVGVRGRVEDSVKTAQKSVAVDVWDMERLELDGESAYRSMLNRHLSRGPIALSIDVRGLDPDLMTAVQDPLADGLDWSFLKRSLEQCVPHIDRVLGIDICELDPTQDDAHHGAMMRFAETLAPFLRRLTR